MSNAAVVSADSLYRDHGDWLFRWLRYRLGCANDAADLTHDTYERILVSGRLPRPEQSRPYLVRVAKGLAIDLHRRRALERAYLDALAAQPEALWPSEEQRAVVLDALARIDRALEGLPASARETFLMARFEGLRYATIAQRLGVSYAAVRKYMLKATAACLAAIDPQPGSTQ